VGRKRRLIVDSEDEGYAPDTTETPANKRRSVTGGGQAGGAVDLTGDDMDVTGGAADAPVSGSARAASSGGGRKAVARGKAHKDSPDAGSTEASEGDSGEGSEDPGGEGEEEDSEAGSEDGTEESDEEQSEDSASDLDGPALYYKVRWFRHYLTRFLSLLCEHETCNMVHFFVGSVYACRIICSVCHLLPAIIFATHLTLVLQVNSMMDRREGRDEELNTITGMRKVRTHRPFSHHLPPIPCYNRACGS
jgi:hypothetical protein